MMGKWKLREGRSIDLPTSLTTCGHSLVDGLGAIRQRPKMLRIRRDLTLSSLPHIQLYWPKARRTYVMAWFPSSVRALDFFLFTR
ncbi:hypothetical protein DPMN_058310 [Dreissena polymorpha]|uniref:Uncharacterized protein n=1 Tax=Dreissena polymorpha TaxID=45954 RepID=A0A9D4C1I2_DREPO|nr:hypothetical protein DPMN_058310 [Dreissena polymorpha]